MSARNSGASLVLELSRSIVDQLFHELFLAKPSGAVLACSIWPAPAATVNLVAAQGGDATLGGNAADGTAWGLNLSLSAYLTLALGASLEDYVTRLAASLLPTGGAVIHLPLRVAGGGTALAGGVFLNVVAGQNLGAFDQYAEDFLQGRQIGAAASIELIQSLFIGTPSTQALLRQSLDPYTPDNPNLFASLSPGPTGSLRLSGSGTKHTPDCDIHIDWHVDLTPSIVDGYLTVRAQYDYSTSAWDVFTCAAGHVLLGALPGILTGSLLVAIIGAFLNFPNFGSGSTTMSQCGDKCVTLTIRNPASSDGRLKFTIADRHSLAITDIGVDRTGVTLLGNVTITPKHSILHVLEGDTWIYPTAESVCAGEGILYHPGTFQLHNPATGSTDFDLPQICSIILTPDALGNFAEVAFVPPQNLPLSLADVEPVRVEVRVKAGAQVQALTGSALIRTNTAPFTRIVSIFVASPQPGTIQVDPPVVSFDQRNVEVVDPGSLRTRGACAEQIPVTRNVPQGGLLTIRNTGAGTLQICDLQLQDPSGFFQLPAQRSFTLLSGTQTGIPILLRVGTPVNQLFAATVTVVSNDPATPRIDVQLVGEAIDPPQGAEVGGQSAVIDTLFDSACIAARIIDNPPIIDLGDWQKIFVQPVPEPEGGLDIFQTTLNHAGDNAVMLVNGPNGQVFTARPGPPDTLPELTLTQDQIGKLEMQKLDKGADPHVHLLAFRLNPITNYTAVAPINDFWSSGLTAALATEKGLEFVNLRDVAKPGRIGVDEKIAASRLVGRSGDVYALTKDCIEFFRLEPEVGHRASLPIPGVTDLDWWNGPFAFALRSGSIVTLGLDPDGVLEPLKETKFEVGATQLRVVSGFVYLFGKELLSAFAIAEPWLLEPVGELNLPGVSSIARQGKRLVARSTAGTFVFQPDNTGKPLLMSEYPGGYWSDAMLADRLQTHLFRINPGRNSFEILAFSQKQARPPG